MICCQNTDPDLSDVKDHLHQRQQQPKGPHVAVSPLKKMSCIAVTVLAVLYALPNLYEMTRQAYLGYPASQINLGLTCKAGHICFYADINAVERERLDDLAENVRRFAEAGLNSAAFAPPGAA